MATHPDIQILSSDLARALKDNPALIQQTITPAHVLALSRKIANLNGQFLTLSREELRACALIDDVACSIDLRKMPSPEQFRDLPEAVATVESL